MQGDRSERLCVLAMPLDMGVADFCSFVGGYLPKLREMRVVRREDGKSVCLILLRFETLEIADGFFHDYHDKPVSLLDCRCLYSNKCRYTTVIWKITSWNLIRAAACSSPHLSQMSYVGLYMSRTWSSAVKKRIHNSRLLPVIFLQSCCQAMLALTCM